MRRQTFMQQEEEERQIVEAERVLLGIYKTQRDHEMDSARDKGLVRRRTVGELQSKEEDAEEVGRQIRMDRNRRDKTLDHRRLGDFSRGRSWG